MMKHILEKYTLATALAVGFVGAQADDTLFSTNLYAKFQAKSCTQCHDFHQKDLKGFFYNTHVSRRDPSRCVTCHTTEVNGFEDPGDWFTKPGLYDSSMDAKTTCEKTKEAMGLNGRSPEKQAKLMEHHLFTDPRVLWGIEGATPKSGHLPFGKKEANMVMGGFEEWKTQVMAWINGGMKCE